MMKEKSKTRETDDFVAEKLAPLRPDYHIACRLAVERCKQLERDRNQARECAEILEKHLAELHPEKPLPQLPWK